MFADESDGQRGSVSIRCFTLGDTVALPFGSIVICWPQDRTPLSIDLKVLVAHSKGG